MTTSTQCLTIPQVAAELQLSRSSVYNLIRRRELRAVIVLGKRRVRRTDLQRYLEMTERRAG